MVRHVLVHAVVEHEAPTPAPAAAAASGVTATGINFAASDENHNGLLQLQTQTDSSSALVHLDINSDGLVSRAEFDAADSSKDGILTEDELSVIQALHAPGSNSSADDACHDRYPAAKSRLQTTIHTAMAALNGTDGMAAAVKELLAAVANAISVLEDKEMILETKIEALRAEEAKMSGLRKECTDKTHTWMEIVNSTDCRHSIAHEPCFTNLHDAASEKMHACDELANAVQTLEAAEAAVHVVELAVISARADLDQAEGHQRSQLEKHQDLVDSTTRAERAAFRVYWPLVKQCQPDEQQTAELVAAHDELIMAAAATYSAVANGEGPDGPLAACPADSTTDEITAVNFAAKCPKLIKTTFKTVQDSIANAANQLNHLLGGVPDCHALWKELQAARDKLAEDKRRLDAARATRKADCAAYSTSLTTFEDKLHSDPCTADPVSCQDDLDTLGQDYELKGRQCGDADIRANELANLVAADQKRVDELTKALKKCKDGRLNGLNKLQGNVNVAVQQQRCASAVYQAVLAKCDSTLESAEDKTKGGVEDLLVDDADTQTILALLQMLSDYGDAIHQISHPVEDVDQ